MIPMTDPRTSECELDGYPAVKYAAMWKMQREYKGLYCAENIGDLETNNLKLSRDTGYRFLRDESTDAVRIAESAMNQHVPENTIGQLKNSVSSLVNQTFKFFNFRPMPWVLMPGFMSLYDS